MAKEPSKEEMRRMMAQSFSTSLDTLGNTEKKPAKKSTAPGKPEIVPEPEASARKYKKGFTVSVYPETKEKAMKIAWMRHTKISRVLEEFLQDYINKFEYELENFEKLPEEQKRNFELDSKHL